MDYFFFTILPNLKNTKKLRFFSYISARKSNVSIKVIKTNNNTYDILPNKKEKISFTLSDYIKKFNKNFYLNIEDVKSIFINQQTGHNIVKKRKINKKIRSLRDIRRDKLSIGFTSWMLHPERYFKFVKKPFLKLYTYEYINVRFFRNHTEGQTLKEKFYILCLERIKQMEKIDIKTIRKQNEIKHLKMKEVKKREISFRKRYQQEKQKNYTGTFWHSLE